MKTSRRRSTPMASPTTSPVSLWARRSRSTTCSATSTPHARYFLIHLIEEYARHAGHADIIREQIDGMAVPALVMTLEGVPANQFFAPYEPAAGTIGA